MHVLTVTSSDWDHRKRFEAAGSRWVLNQVDCDTDMLAADAMSIESLHLQ